MELVTKICAKCGKEIKLGYLPRGSYIYKRYSKYYCSLKCYESSKGKSRRVL